MILGGILVAVPAVAQRQAVGIFFQWGAFREAGRCFAMAVPEDGRQDSGAYASIGYWPDRRLAGQIHFRLSREKRPESAVLLKIDDASFQLIGGGAEAWAPDRRADAAIVAAMRSGIEMRIETRGAGGRLVRDRYGLRGAATAIDAAAVACARR